MRRANLLALALLSPAPAAQDFCEGNGYGGAYMEMGPAYLGGFFSHDVGSPNAPSSFVVIAFSDGFDQSFHPLVGTVCLDLFSPAFGLLLLPTDGSGNVHFDLFLPAVPSWVSLPPFYANALTFEGGAWSISKTVPRWFENPDSWTPVSSLGTARMYHTATNLGADGKDDRIKVFVAGGGGGTVTVPSATNTTELFDPLSRSFTAGPAMQVERATHTATRLQDGRILLAGGLDSLGVCHASCEIYDRTTDTLAPTGSMTAPRAGHTATLLDDGRVLVTGGFADYQDPSTAWFTALNTSQNTAEIYDPATGAWTPVTQLMSAKRSAHSATKLADGRVMLINGIAGGAQVTTFPPFGPIITVPFFASTVELFDPATETFSPLPDLVVGAFLPSGRAFHGASLLGDGRVLVTGGVYRGGPNGEAISTADCQAWDGSSWTTQGSLPLAVAWHNQITLDNGKALVSGGLSADGVSLGAQSSTAVHDGTGVVTQNAIGLNPGIPGSVAQGRGAMTVTRMHDGGLLFLGGSTGSLPVSLATGFVYTPKP